MDRAHGDKSTAIYFFCFQASSSELSMLIVHKKWPNWPFFACSPSKYYQTNMLLLRGDHLDDPLFLGIIYSSVSSDIMRRDSSPVYTIVKL